MNEFDELSSSLSDEASGIEVEPTAMALDQVRSGTTKRRRRRRALAGSVSALALVAGGLVAVNAVGGDSGSDSLSIAGPEDEVVAETTSTTTTLETDGATVSEGSESDDGAGAPVEQPVVEVGSTGVATPVNVVEQAAISVAGPAGGDTYTEWLAAWDDGFLSASRTFTPQSLPTELSEEISALFPQEVLDLFEGGLPSTIEEATSMLTEAGLLDEVTDVLAEHPEASEAIYSQPTAEPVYEVLFTTDGEEWEPLEFVLPEGVGDIRTVRSTGDRLAVLSQVQTQFTGSSFDSPAQDGAIYLSSTTDLLNWDVTELSNDGRPADLPEVLSYSVYPQGLAANADGWVATAFESIDIRLEALGELFPDLGAALQANIGLGYGYDEQGIEISVEPGEYDNDGNPIPLDPATRQEFNLTWDELGVDQAFVPSQRGNDASMWAASWGNSPVSVEAESAPYDIVAADNGFYGVAETLLYSADGVSWTKLTSPVESFGVQGPLPIGDGVAVMVMTEAGSITYRVNGATDVWEPIDLDGIPDNLSGNFGNSGAVWMLVEQDVPEPTSITVEADGFTLTQSDNLSGSTVLLVDADGNEVINETWNRRSDDDPGVLEYSLSGIDVVDPVSGEVIVSIDSAVMEAAYREAYPSSIEESYDPDVWLLASVDGDNWIVDHLGQSPDGEFFGPGASAINGSTVLIANGQQWNRYDL